jgi:hypothetical protein
MLRITASDCHCDIFRLFLIVLLCRYTVQRLNTQSHVWEKGCIFLPFFFLVQSAIRYSTYKNTKSRRRRDRIVVVLQLPMQSVSITTDAVRQNHATCL